MANVADKELTAAMAALRQEAHTLVDKSIDDIYQCMITEKGRPRFNQYKTSMAMPFIKLSFGMKFKK